MKFENLPNILLPKNNKILPLLYNDLYISELLGIFLSSLFAYPFHVHLNLVTVRLWPDF